MLETTLQSGILLNIFSILIQRRGTDAVKLASCQHRLQHIAGIHGSLCFSGAHNQVQLINKEDNSSVALAHFLQNSLQTLLKLSSVLGARHKGSHVQGKNRLVTENLRHILGNNTLRKSFHHGSFADAGLTDQNRVVFCLT